MKTHRCPWVEIRPPLSLLHTSFRMRCGFWVAMPLLCLLAACPPPDQVTEQEEIARAEAMARDDSLPIWPAAEAGKPVVLYVDRSQSMRGFLDPEFPAQVRTDYRSVLDGFDARLRPSAVFGFGNEVRAAEKGGLGVLGDREFYSDGNTEMEDVFARVEADSALGATHVIIGDGRRGDPNAANGQFVAMRELAEGWINRGGTFMVASSAAPFRPVENDPAGCRASGNAPQTCPLYAFAFVAPGDQGRVAAAFAAVFEHLYLTPLPAVRGADVRMTSPGTAQISLGAGWTTARDGTPIARVRGSVATNSPLRATLVLRDTVSPLGRASLLAIRGRRLVPDIAVRTLASDTAASPWKPSPAKGALMRPVDGDPLAYEFFSRGPGPGVPRYLYRLELHPAGEPSWLREFDAENGGDSLRTFGLGRLFEGFRAKDPHASPPVLRIYAVVN